MKSMKSMKNGVCVRLASNVFSLVLLMLVQSDHSVYEYRPDNGRGHNHREHYTELMWPASFVPANIQPLYWGYIYPQNTPEYLFIEMIFVPKVTFICCHLIVGGKGPVQWVWEGLEGGGVAYGGKILLIPLFTPCSLDLHLQLLWRWCQLLRRCVV